MWPIFVILTLVLMVLTIVEKAWKLYDRWEATKLSNELDKLMEEEEAYKCEK